MHEVHIDHQIYRESMFILISSLYVTISISVKLMFKICVIIIITSLPSKRAWSLPVSYPCVYLTILVLVSMGISESTGS